MYSVLVVVHVLAALVAFGAVALNGVYAGSARRPDGVEDAARYFSTRAVADAVMLAVPVLGLAAVADGGTGLGQAWVAIALVLWVIAAAVVFGVARPARREVRAGLAVGDTETLLRPATRLLRAAAIVDVVFVVAVVDMIVKPG